MPTRRQLLAALAATAACRKSADCVSPPGYQPRVDRTFRKSHPDAGQRAHGFVNYYQEWFPFGQGVLVQAARERRSSFPTPATVPSCSIAHAELRPPSWRDAAYAGERGSNACWDREVEVQEAWLQGLQELEAALARAPSDAQIVPVGSHHSSSAAYHPGEDWGRAFAVDVRGLNQVWPLAGFGEADRWPVFLGAGTTVCEANRALWDLGRGFHNLGSYDGQTLAGAMATGTHGSGARLGPISDAVQAVFLLAPNDPEHPGRWKRWQIQASDAPARALLPGFTVKADDGLFEALLCALGGLGVLVGFVVETVPCAWVRERRSPAFWHDLGPGPAFARRMSAPPASVRQQDSFRYELVVSPAAVDRSLPDPTQTHAVVEVHRDEWPLDLDMEDAGRTPAPLLALAGGLSQAIDLRPLRPGIILQDQLLFGSLAEDLTDRSYRVLKIGAGEQVQAWGMEAFVPLSSAWEVLDLLLCVNRTLDPEAIHRRPRKTKLQADYQRVQDWAQAAPAARAALATLREGGWGGYLTNPFGVRVVGGSRRGHLLPCRADLPSGGREPGEPMVTFELSHPVARQEGRNQEGKTQLEAWASLALAAHPQVRLHWGQLNRPFDAAALADRYPAERIQAWRSAKQFFDPQQRFRTALLAQLGLV